MEIKLHELIEECKKYLDEEPIVEIMHFYEYGFLRKSGTTLFCNSNL